MSFVITNLFAFAQGFSSRFQFWYLALTKDQQKIMMNAQIWDMTQPLYCNDDCYYRWSATAKSDLSVQPNSQRNFSMGYSSGHFKDLLDAMGNILAALDRCEQDENASVVDELTEEIEQKARTAYAAALAATESSVHGSLPMLIHRPEDMSKEGKLSVCRDNEGDILISVITSPDRMNELAPAIEFVSQCRRSPRTFAALNELIEAMRLDNLEKPLPGQLSDCDEL